MERRAVLQSLLVLAGVAWAGNSPAQPHSPKLIRINIPGPHLLPFLPIELIPRLGYDRALGVQLAIRYMPSGVQALENVLAGDAAFAGVGFSVMPNFAVQGKPVVALATLSSGTPPYAVLVRNDLARTIRSLKDLRGRSIGIPLGSATTKTYLQTLMELWLEAYGISNHEVRWVPTSMNLDGMHGALVSGSVDAVFCEEPLSGTLVRTHVGVMLASLADPNNPARIVGRQHLRAVIASTPEAVAANPTQAELMVKMVQRSLHWVRKTPPRKIVARLGISSPEQAEDIADAIRRVPELYSPDGKFLAREIESTRQFLTASRAPLPADFDIRKLIDDRWTNKTHK